MKIILLLASLLLACCPEITGRAVYFGAGSVVGTASILVRAGWGISLISPWASTIGNECLLLGHVCDGAAQYAFSQMLKKSTSPLFGGIPHSHSSWHLNQLQLSQIPAFSDEEKQLLFFFQKRWLAKSTGIYSALVDWISPCFGIDVQVHPESTNSYARDPSNKFSQTYMNIVDAWKKSLPGDYPLILTRPCDIRDYLPHYIDVSQEESLETMLERLALKMQTTDARILIDFTEVIALWNDYKDLFLQGCIDRHLNVGRIVAIQRLHRQEIGGIYLLPLVDTSANLLEEHHQYLLEWISKFGLSANRIELDRCSLNIPPVPRRTTSSIFDEFQSKAGFISYINTYGQNQKLVHVQKSLMLTGTLRVLKQMLTDVADEKYDEIIDNPTRSSVIQLSFSQIKEHLDLIEQEGDEALFYNFASHLEQVHSHISTLLELFSPYSAADFSSIYGSLLVSGPEDLKHLTSYAVHTSGMTSLAGIFKSQEIMLGRTPFVLYGENTYFENIYAAQCVSKAVPIAEATEKDWEEAELILAQFNPALRRIDFQISEYKVENVSSFVQKALMARKNKPLTLALDCTLDFIDSLRVGKLLTEFQEEIEKGTLNVICYRSGIKYDLFGMDNYCGAPFYMVHNQDVKWTAFDLLLSSPALQTDRLSFNWFCLAYKSAAPQLEQYRKQIFDNTRALLDRAPARLLTQEDVRYRIVPIQRDADASFIDIKIFGPLHEVRGGLLVGGFLTLKCMESGHPIFYRPSLGFYHPNFSMLFSNDCTTVRLTLGLDPSQVDVLVDCFEKLDALNGAPWQMLQSKLQKESPLGSLSIRLASPRD